MRGRADINSVQALLLYNIGDKELTAGELRTRGYYLGSNVSYNLKKLVELGFLDHQRSRVDRRSVRIRLTPGPGNPPHRRRALSKARQDRGAGRWHLQRGVRHPEQVAAPARTVLDRSDPVPALRSIDRNKWPSRHCKRPAAITCNTSPMRIGPGIPAGAFCRAAPQNSFATMEPVRRVGFIPAHRRTEVMLVERGLQVMNVEAVGDAYAIASNYLRKSGAFPTSSAPTTC